jgi:hypothetical protein
MKDKQFYTVSVRTFVIPFLYGSDSAKTKYYGSNGSGSATLLSIATEKKNSYIYHIIVGMRP